MAEQKRFNRPLAKSPYTTEAWIGNYRGKIEFQSPTREKPLYNGLNRIRWYRVDFVSIAHLRKAPIQPPYRMT